MVAVRGGPPHQVSYPQSPRPPEASRTLTSRPGSGHPAASSGRIAQRRASGRTPWGKCKPRSVRMEVAAAIRARVRVVFKAGRRHDREARPARRPPRVASQARAAETDVDGARAAGCARASSRTASFSRTKASRSVRSCAWNRWRCSSTVAADQSFCRSSENA